MISSVQTLLGACASGIFFLTTGGDTSASDAFLLATTFDSRWGLFLPVISTMIIARCINRGLATGYDPQMLYETPLIRQRLCRIPSYSLARETLRDKECHRRNIRENGLGRSS